MCYIIIGEGEASNSIESQSDDHTNDGSTESR